MSVKDLSRRVVLATHNAHKVDEIRRILGSAGIELIGLDQFPDIGEVVESGATFAENALLKAQATARATGLVAIADDSGIAVDALNGMPGVLSVYWAGRARDDAANLRLVLEQIDDVPDERRGAAFVCAAAAATPDGRERVVEGRVEGSLAREPRGDGGFGYDPIFVPAGETRTTAQMSAAEKDAISHRGAAFRALLPLLDDLLEPAGKSAPAASSGHPEESPVPQDPARGLRRLLALLVLLALAAAGGAFALSQLNSSRSTTQPQPSLFPKTFNQAGFVTGTATLVTSYDAAATARRITATLTARGNVYLVVTCRVGTARLAIGSLTNTGPCTGKPDAVLALNLTRDTTVTATVGTTQSERWGLALYR